MRVEDGVETEGYGPRPRGFARGLGSLDEALGGSRLCGWVGKEF